MLRYDQGSGRPVAVWCSLVLALVSSQYSHKIFLAGDVEAVGSICFMCQHSEPQRSTVRSLLWQTEFGLL